MISVGLDSVMSMRSGEVYLAQILTGEEMKVSTTFSVKSASKMKMKVQKKSVKSLLGSTL